jgi:creatinine amidohydrolase/Fe(II)-dependent formamide hydrolase-like protein
MLHLAGEHVKMERAVRTEPKSGNAFPDFIRPRRYGDSTDTGVVGDGTLGTAEKGAETVRRAVARTLEFIRSDEFATPA